MARVVVSAMVLGLVGLFSWDVRSQPAVGGHAVAPPEHVSAPAQAPTTASTPSPSAAAPGGPANDDAAFDAEVQRYARLRAFTDQLEAAREREAFESSAQRFARLEEFNRKLREARELEDQREFDATVTAYLRKQAFTRALVEHRGKAEPSE